MSTTRKPPSSASHRSTAHGGEIAVKPSDDFLVELAGALNNSEHKNVAEHLAAGLLWAMYPQWFEENYGKITKGSGKGKLYGIRDSSS